MTTTERPDQINTRKQYQLVVWLGAITWGLYILHYVFTQQFFNAGTGMHPLSFLFFSLAFIAAAFQSYSFRSQALLQWEPKLRRALAGVLVVFVGLRLIEQALGHPIEALAWIAGDAYGATGYASWGTALSILALLSIASFHAKPVPKALFFTSYAIFWAIVLIFIDYMLQWLGVGQAHAFLPGGSGESVVSILFLAAVVFPRSPIWDSLFDARTSRSTSIVATVIFFGLAAAVVGSMLSLPFEFASFAVIIGLFFLASELRRRELSAMAAEGRLTPDGALIEQSRGSVMRRLPNIERRGFAKLFYDVNFVKPIWVQDSLHILAVFVLAVSAIALSRTEGNFIATLWPVNPVITYFLLINPIKRWFGIVIYAYVAVLVANLVMGNPLAPSAMLTWVNLFEALTLAIALRISLRAFVNGRVVQIQELTIERLAWALGLLSFGLLISSLLGGFFVSKLFGGAILGNIWIWMFGTGLGWFAIIPVIIGILMEVHWGFPKVRHGIRRFWLVAPVGWLMYGIFVEEIYLIKGMFAVSFAAFALMGVGFRSLWQAGLHLTVCAGIASYGLHRFGHITDSVPYVLLAITIMVSLIVQGVFLFRMLQERLNSEINLVAYEGPSTVLTLDAEGCIVSCTERLVDFTGQSREAVVGRSLMDVLGVETPHPDIPPQGVSRWHTLETHNDRLLGVEIHTQVTENYSMPFTYICALRDLSDTVLAERARIEQIDRSKSILVTQDEDRSIVHCSDAWCAMIGYSREETIGKELNAFLATEEMRALGMQRMEAKPLLETDLGYYDNDETVYEFRTKSGDIRMCRIRYVYTGANPDNVTVTLEDVTELIAEQKRNTVLLELNTTLLQKSPGIILSQDKNWNIVSCSDAWVNQLGYSKGETLGRDLLEFMHPDEREKNRIFREQVEVNGEFPVNSVKFVTKGGEVRIFELKSVFTTVNNEWQNVISMVDITELMNAQETLTRLVERDELTGLLSRRGFKKRLDTEDRPRDVVVFLLDLDHFKSVNDSYSHQVGDALLQAVGQTLERLTVDCGCAVRLGGEEFAIIRPWTNWEEAKEFGEQLRQAIARTEVIEGSYVIKRTASIGAAFLAKRGLFSEALTLADMMVREAKAGGRDQIRLADPAAVEELGKRGAFITTKEVQEGLNSSEFYYAVQPIWNVETKIIEGFEALLRWERPDGRVISPAQFAPLFDEVTRSEEYQKKNYELRKAVIGALSDFPHAYISFNYQLERLGNPHAAAEMIGRFEAIKDHPERVIMVELSEHAFGKRTDKAILLDVLNHLRESGFLIALDDFGVESSNINRLNEFPIDVVKIDKSFIDDLLVSQNVRSLLRGLALTMRNLKLRVIVEGVETVQQARMLKHYHLNSQQGYLHAKPMRAADVSANLAKIGAEVADRATIEEIRARTLSILNQ